MELSNIYLTRLLQKSPDDAADSKCHLYVQSRWDDKGLQLVVQDSLRHKCYKGKLTKAELKKEAAELEMDYDAYYAECHSALTTSVALPGFECEIDEEEKVFRLNKKQDFDMLYLEVKLKECTHNYEMLDTAIQLVEDSQQAAELKAKSTQQHDKSYEELLECYQLCVEEKDKWKREMLERFALVLNAKKDKIARLQRELEQNKSDNRPANDEEMGQEDSSDAEIGQSKESPKRRSKTTSKSILTTTTTKRQTRRSKTEPTKGEEQMQTDDADFDAETQRMTPPSNADDNDVAEEHTKRKRRGRLVDNDDEEEN